MLSAFTTWARGSFFCSSSPPLVVASSRSQRARHASYQLDGPSTSFPAVNGSIICGHSAAANGSADDTTSAHSDGGTILHRSLASQNPDQRIKGDHRRTQDGRNDPLLAERERRAVLSFT